MRLTTKGRYAVMAMADLAAHSSGHSMPLAEIAQRQGISLSYLEQLFCRLRIHGLVSSMRGPGGGYKLARPPQDVMVSDIINAVDEAIQTGGCGLDDAFSTCRDQKGRCLTHDLWQGLAHHIQAYLGSVSLADVIEPKGIACPLHPKDRNIHSSPGDGTL